MGVRSLPELEVLFNNRFKTYFSVASWQSDWLTKGPLRLLDLVLDVTLADCLRGTNVVLHVLSVTTD